jgi:ABC-2 type transport system permease protein
VLLVGPELISQDLRFNAIPLYLSRPVRRIDYFAGKLGVIGSYLAAVTIVPILLAFALGYGFSLDPLVVRDTWRILLASLAFGAIIVASAGTLMLAISSLSRNSRYVGAMWVGLWVVSNVASGVLNQTIRQDWCPLLSYTGNLNRIREALLDSEAAWSKVSALFQTGQDTLRDAAGRGRSRRGRVGRFTFNFSPPSAAPAPPAPPSPGHTHSGDGRSAAKAASYPWQWSAGVLAGLAGLSVWILATRVRSLDRLR